MATVTCPNCGSSVDADRWICPRCFSNLTSAPTAPVATVRPATPVQEAPAPRATGVCPRDWCGETYPAGATTCPRCAQPVPPLDVLATSLGVSAVRMLLPDGGTVGIRPYAIVVLGRESPDARIADSLVAYDGVSRLHAELVVRDTDVTLADSESTNGTWVDGRKVSLDPVPLELGQHQVRLGQAALVVIDVVAGGSR
ncbi:FHA domain-containing protein [Kribbella sp. NPDC051137]|uniref:FHA domain-containing protein n=1 Tax=Kribbella sp. NPDC051137 TaxID=3155045 RepID=UPI002F7CEE70